MRPIFRTTGILWMMFTLATVLSMLLSGIFPAMIIGWDDLIAGASRSHLHDARTGISIITQTTALPDYIDFRAKPFIYEIESPDGQYIMTIRDNTLELDLRISSKDGQSVASLVSIDGLTIKDAVWLNEEELLISQMRASTGNQEVLAYNILTSEERLLSINDDMSVSLYHETEIISTQRMPYPILLLDWLNDGETAVIFSESERNYLLYTININEETPIRLLTSLPRARWAKLITQGHASQTCIYTIISDESGTFVYCINPIDGEISQLTQIGKGANSFPNHYQAVEIYREMP